MDKIHGHNLVQILITTLLILLDKIQRVELAACGSCESCGIFQFMMLNFNGLRFYFNLISVAYVAFYFLLPAAPG